MKRFVLAAVAAALVATSVTAQEKALTRESFALVQTQLRLAAEDIQKAEARLAEARKQLALIGQQADAPSCEDGKCQPKAQAKPAQAKETLVWNPRYGAYVVVKTMPQACDANCQNGQCSPGQNCQTCQNCQAQRAAPKATATAPVTTYYYTAPFGNNCSNGQCPPQTQFRRR